MANPRVIETLRWLHLMGLKAWTQETGREPADTWGWQPMREDWMVEGALALAIEACERLHAEGYTDPGEAISAFINPNAPPHMAPPEYSKYGARVNDIGAFVTVGLLRIHQALSAGSLYRVKKDREIAEKTPKRLPSGLSGGGGGRSKRSKAADSRSGKEGGHVR